MEDPVRKNQSKHVGEDGQLRYDADNSLVFPGPTGVRHEEAREEYIESGLWPSETTDPDSPPVP